MIKKKAIILAILSCISITSSNIYSLSLAERRAFFVIRNLQRLISYLENDLEQVEKSAPGIGRLTSEIKEKKDELLKLRRELGIGDVETQKNAVKQQLDLAAAQAYASAVNERTKANLYSEVYETIKNIFDDQDTKRLLKEIVERERKIAEKIENELSGIYEKGTEIRALTSEIQKGLGQIKSQLIGLDLQSIQKKASLPPEKIKKLAELESEIAQKEKKIVRKIAKLPTQSKNKIQQLENAIRRYRLILELMRDPKKIHALSPEVLLGIEAMDE
jgi:vacuolar-type H+-ATPase subunit I/STV1